MVAGLEPETFPQTPAFQSDFTICLQGHMVGKTGLEPATPGSQNQCSNQLNYFPIIAVF